MKPNKYHFFIIAFILFFIPFKAVCDGNIETNTLKPKIPANGQDWQLWRGINGNSISEETDWNLKSIIPEPKIVWQINVGDGFSSIVIKGSYFFTMGYKSGEEVVYCLDIETGDEIWTLSYPGVRGQYLVPKSTPCIDNDRVYTLSQNGHLFCLNLSDGNVLWEKDLVKNFYAVPPAHGFAGSPIIKDNLLILNVCQNGLVLDKISGEEIWCSQSTYCGYTSPVLYTLNNTDYGIFFGHDAVYGTVLQTGEIVWSFPWFTTYAPADSNVPDPLVFNNTVFITNYYIIGSVLLEIGNTEVNKTWEDTSLCCFNSPLYADGYIYGNNGSPQGITGSYFCFDPSTKQFTWQQELGVGSLIKVGDKLILLEQYGTIYIINANPHKYEEISRGKLPFDIYWTPPVFCRKHLIIRNRNGDVYCISLTEQ